jgi:hypothetical protein
MLSRDDVFADQEPGEIGLLTLFIFVSAYMFVDAGSYRDIIGLYPRVLSGVVLVCGLLLLFRNVLPDALQESVTGSGGELGSSSEVAEEIGSGDDEPSSPQSRTGRTSRTQVLLTLLIGGYLLLSYLVGMYFATPVFVFAYGMVHALDWKTTIGLTVLASVIAHVFLVVFNAPITSGILL